MAVEKFADKTLTEYSRCVAAADGLPGGGSVIALCGSCASALGLMVTNLSRGKASCAQYADDIEKCSKALETLRVYMLHLVDEDIKAFAPLAKYAPMDKSDPETMSHYQASLRLACAIPTEVMYKMTECAEYLGVLAEKGCIGALSDAGIALHLCKAIMEGARLTCLANARCLQDEVYAMTVAREFEIVFRENMPKIDSAIKMVEQRLAR